MVTEAQVVNLGKAIQNDIFIMGIFTDHENPVHKWYDQTMDYIFWENNLLPIICSLGMLLGFVLRCFSSVYVLESTCLFHNLAIY